MPVSTSTSPSSVAIAVDVGEAVDERDAVRDLGPAARAAERVVVGLALPDPLRQCEDVGHGLRIRARS